MYDAWVPADAPEPRVVEVDGSTVDVGWHPVADVLSGALPVTDIVTEALADHRPFRLQRIGVYGLVRRGDAVLLTRISPLGAHSGLVDAARAAGSTTARRPATRWPARWPRRPGSRRRSATCSTSTTSTSTARRRRVATRTSTGSTWSSGHGCPTRSSPGSSRPGGTTDAVAFVPVADVEAGRLEVLDVVRAALAADT